MNAIKEPYVVFANSLSDFNGELKYVDDICTREVMSYACDVLEDLYDDGIDSHRDWMGAIYQFFLWMQEDLYEDGAPHRYGRYLSCLRTHWSEVRRQLLGGVLAVYLNTIEASKQEDMQDPQSYFWESYLECYRDSKDIRAYGSHRSTAQWVYYDDVLQWMEAHKVGGLTFADHFREWAETNVEPQVGGMHMLPGLTCFGAQLNEICETLPESWLKETVPFYESIEDVIKTHEFERTADFMLHTTSWGDAEMYIDCGYTTLYITGDIHDIGRWYEDFREEWEHKLDEDEDVQFYEDFGTAYLTWIHS